MTSAIAGGATGTAGATAMTGAIGTASAAGIVTGTASATAMTGAIGIASAAGIMTGIATGTTMDIATAGKPDPPAFAETASPNQGRPFLLDLDPHKRYIPDGETFSEIWVLPTATFRSNRCLNEWKPGMRSGRAENRQCW